MITLIACVDKQRGIGYKGELLCHLPNGLKHFKELTKGTICIQGRKTYESIVKRNGYALPDRTNIVLTRDYEYVPSDIETMVYTSVEDIIHEYEAYAEGNADVSIVGGQQIYEQFLPYADRIVLTVIHDEFEKVDSYFPEFSLNDWKVTQHIENPSDDDHSYNYSFVTYIRKRK